MRTVLPSGQFEPFSPETIAAMQAAYEAACRAIPPTSSKSEIESLREAIAMRIIDAAKAGLSTVDDLRDDALAHVRSRL